MCPIVSLLRFKFVIGHRKSTNLCPNLISGRLFKTPVVNFAKFYGFEMNYFRRWPRSETKTENLTIILVEKKTNIQEFKLGIPGSCRPIVRRPAPDACLDIRGRKFWPGQKMGRIGTVNLTTRHQIPSFFENWDWWKNLK